MSQGNKISSLERLSTFSVEDVVPIVHNGGNFAATMASLKEYFRDSTLILFDDIDAAEVEITPGDSGFEEGFEYAIVYMPYNKAFAKRRHQNGVVDYYFSDFEDKEDYMTDDVVRTDKVFFCLANKDIYTYNGELRNIFDTVRINAMTEEEFNNLTNPIEGAFYATYE